MVEVRCPYCGALQFKVSGVVTIDIEVKCRGRKCGRILRITARPPEPPITIVEVVGVGIEHLSKPAYKPVEHK